MKRFWRWFRGPHPRPCYLYRLYNRTGLLLYVGISVNPERRIQEHRRRQPWGSRISHYETERYGSIEKAAVAEVEAIRKERPKYNILHNRRKSIWRRLFS